jgi:hypothetical protein
VRPSAPLTAGIRSINRAPIHPTSTQELIVPNLMKNESSPTKRGCMPPKTTRETTFSVVARPPAERGLTKFETLSCERWNEAWEAYPALEHVHVGYVDARSFGGQAIVVDIEDDLDRWGRIVDPLVDEFGDPVPNEEADGRITLNLRLRTAKRLLQLLQKAVAALEIEQEVVDAYYEMPTRQAPDGG